MEIISEDLAIDLNEVAEIKSKYEALIAQANKDEIGLLKDKCQQEINETILRQRKELIKEGGELAERIIAENDRYGIRQYETPTDLEDIECPYCHNIVKKRIICTRCGHRLDQ